MFLTPLLLCCSVVKSMISASSYFYFRFNFIHHFTCHGFVLFQYFPVKQGRQSKVNPITCSWMFGGPDVNVDTTWTEAETCDVDCVFVVMLLSCHYWTSVEWGVCVCTGPMDGQTTTTGTLKNTEPGPFSGRFFYLWPSTDLCPFNGDEHQTHWALQSHWIQTWL